MPFNREPEYTFRETDLSRTTQTQVGAVIVFRPGVDVKTAQELLNSLAMFTEGRPEVRRFNPDHGMPVWYVP